MGLFRDQQRNAEGDDRAWAARVARDMEILIAGSHRELEIEHPGMPPISDLDAVEMIRAVFVDDNEDPDDDLDDEGLGEHGRTGDGPLPS